MPLRSLLKRRRAARREKPQSSGYEPVSHFWWQQPRDLPPFDFRAIRAMLIDGEVRLALTMRAAPLCGVEWAYQQGKDWVPGIQARKPEVAAFVARQLRRIWLNHLPAILSAQVWGWSAGEITHRLSSHDLVEIDRLEPRQAADCRLLVADGQPYGVRIERVKHKGHVDLRFPRGWFHAHAPEAGEHYGKSVLLGAYSPWADKCLDGGAQDVRRLFMHKDAYGGTDLGYPVGETYLPGHSEPVPNQHIARQIAEQLTAGGVVTRPSERDENGNEQWPLQRATVPANPQHILKYPQDLDSEIRRGIGIPDDVIDSDGAGGGWAGKRVPMGAFYASLDFWVREIVGDLTEQVFEPLVLLNWGKAEEFEITHKPLAEQAMEQQSNAGPGELHLPAQQPQPGFGQQPQRMSLDPVEAVGAGVLEASKIVAAARSVLRMSNDRPKLGDQKSAGGKTYRFNENHRWELMKGEGGEPKTPESTSREIPPLPSKAEIVDASEIPKPLGRKEALEAGKSIRGEYTNDHTGWEISVFMDAIRDSVYRHSRDFRAILATPTLIKKAIAFRAPESGREERADIKAVYELYAPLRIGEEQYIARMTVLERIDDIRQVEELRLRNTAAIKEKEPSTKRADVGGDAPTVSQGEGSSISIGEFVEKVKAIRDQRGQDA